MKTLYEASNAAEAHMLVDLLKQEGIAADIWGEHLQGAAGELPAMGLVRLAVDEADFKAARSVIEKWEAVEAESAPLQRAEPSKYRGLKGFLLGLVVGVGGLYGVYRTPASANGTDFNGDGVLDESWTYALNGRPLKMEADRNLDGKLDYVASYDMRGLIESAASDDDFNGTFETKTFFLAGNARSAQSDADGDGYPEQRTYFKDGIPESVEYIKASTGRPYKVEHYKLGKLQSLDIDTGDDGKLDTRLTYTPLGEVASRQPLPAQAAH